MKDNMYLSGEKLTIRVENHGPLWALKATKRTPTTHKKVVMFFVCTYQFTRSTSDHTSWAGIQKAID